MRKIIVYKGLCVECKSRYRGILKIHKSGFCCHSCLNLYLNKKYSPEYKQKRKVKDTRKGIEAELIFSKTPRRNIIQELRL